MELDGLLDHPAFYGWFGEIDGDALDREIATTYRRRFAAMSRWLATAGEAKNARVAATIAHHLEVMSPEASLFLAAARTRREHLSDQSKENHNV